MLQRSVCTIEPSRCLQLAPCKRSGCTATRYRPVSASAAVGEAGAGRAGLAGQTPSLKPGLQAWMQSYIKSDEHKRFTQDQLKFLARKRRFTAGKGPAMPEETVCAACDGSGVCTCHQCKGTAVNDKDIEGIMQNELQNIVIRDNGVVNVLWYFQKGGPCWYCRGDPATPCRDCQGTGIRSFNILMYNGD